SYRPGWVAGDPNMFSASALVVLPLMLHPETVARRVWQRVAILGCLFVTLVSFLLAASRGGFIGLFCMYLVQCRKWSHRFIAIAVCVVIIVGCLLAPSSPLDRLLKPSASDIESSNIRLQLWSVSGKIFRDHPVFGIGLFNFAKYMHRYLPPNVDLDFVVPHNTFMEAGVELGTIGLAVFLSVFFFSIRGLARIRAVATSIGDVYFASVTNALISGLAGFGVAAMFISAKHSKLFWFAVFISACMPMIFAETVEGAASSQQESEVPTSTITEQEQPAPAAEADPVRVGNWLMHH
ncbi:MAG TPA: O-antigen ligase family protein, partial [Terriglobales bacterium]